MNHQKHEKVLVVSLLIATLAGLAVVMFYLFYPEMATPTSLTIRHRLKLPSLSLKTSQPLTIKDVPNTESWMTFDYLNKIFVLPANYLATTLKITDSHYPNLTILHYAHKNGIDVRSFLIQVQAAITNYLTPR